MIDNDEKTITNLYLNVCSFNEEMFQNSLQIILRHLTDHYYECKQALKIFDPFHVFLNRSIDKDIKALFAKKTFQIENYKQQLITIIRYEKLLETIPNNIYFPLFNVQCDKIKKNLFNSIGDLKSKLFTKLENNLIDSMRALNGQYNDIVNYIKKITTTPDEVEAMEKYM